MALVGVFLHPRTVATLERLAAGQRQSVPDYLSRVFAEEERQTPDVPDMAVRTVVTGTTFFRLDLDPQTHRRIKQMAAESRCSMRAWVASVVGQLWARRQGHPDA